MAADANPGKRFDGNRPIFNTTTDVERLDPHLQG
jgi:hypothetical protein